ncbi:hypothetical protein L227DRAFT_584354 [Lentinus tigrinus ALCF2SS1-6]|uniref:Uncharacterized protein n=1 Tax=Lentinus tigrinus ALCF2SS1-6 TaxID=1328759 RepID=A0A5C2SKS2_9APHY|nr:hypothetical protein L227DRAFT_584354 [Lentinus tigrinus ALCF2SS1-6]
MSKVSSLRPVLLDPDVLSTPVEAQVLSACLWTTDDDVDLVPTWAARWAGPVSLLVTTFAVPSSAEHIGLLAKLAHIQKDHASLRTRLMVHVLHLAPAAELQPNAFLNLARLLSPSPRTVLFPGNLSYAPPKTLYKTLVSQQPSSSSALSPAGRTRKRKPVVLTSKDHMSFPFASLAPVMIARDDSTWCTERFFAGMSRAGDWEECLWQVWLANFGGVEVKQVQGWTSSGSDVKLHRRLVSRFRSETCSLAMRRFAALRDARSSADTKKTRWLKRVCRSWTSV